MNGTAILTSTHQSEPAFPLSQMNPPAPDPTLFPLLCSDIQTKTVPPAICQATEGIENVCRHQMQESSAVRVPGTWY